MGLQQTCIHVKGTISDLPFQTSLFSKLLVLFIYLFIYFLHIQRYTAIFLETTYFWKERQFVVVGN